MLHNIFWNILPNTLRNIQRACVPAKEEDDGRAEGQDTELMPTGPDSALGKRVPTSKKPAWEIDGFFSTVAYCDWQQDAWVAQLHLQLGEQCLCLPTPEGHKEVPTCGNCKLAAWDTQCSHEERVRVNARVWGSSLARAERKAGGERGYGPIQTQQYCSFDLYQLVAAWPGPTFLSRKQGYIISKCPRGD